MSDLLDLTKKILHENNKTVYDDIANDPRRMEIMYELSFQSPFKHGKAALIYTPFYDRGTLHVEMEKEVLDGYIGDRTMTHIEDRGVTGKPDFAMQERWREPTFQDDRSIEPVEHPTEVYQDMISDLLSA